MPNTPMVNSIGSTNSHRNPMLCRPNRVSSSRSSRAPITRRWIFALATNVTLSTIASLMTVFLDGDHQERRDAPDNQPQQECGSDAAQSVRLHGDVRCAGL